jgi:uncharacterized protein
MDFLFVVLILEVLVKSEGKFDNGQGELSDAAAVLDWIQRQNPNTNESWIVGFSFGSLICMQLLMRRPEIYRFIASLSSAQYL